MRLLVTGAAGFVGTALVQRLAGEGRHHIRAAVHRRAGSFPAGVEGTIGEVAPGADWRPALAEADAVVHLAARVHVMRETAADPLAAFRHTNVAGTLDLARQAAAAGVGRFVYLSSVKVHGESGSFVEGDAPAPEDPYGVSKQEAEAGLVQIARDTGMAVVIVRPPLVYGPGVGGNFRALLRAVSSGVPLPFGAIRNRRSLIALDNLVDFLVTTLEHPAAANEAFLISDAEDLSTTELIRQLAAAMRRPARLVPVPAAALMAAATVIGKRDAARRLLGSLCVDITKARERLGWTPRLSVAEGLRRAVAVER